ncbi:LuxR C-terminal-related transcriptional regulator [Streptomyces acidiscabies]|uniref:helix-turn-helix transcriptional regulator n=1 Tax=Streptomyces acidiscabies TaxID=42234 RepID=UPI0038F7FED6
MVWCPVWSGPMMIFMQVKSCARQIEMGSGLLVLRGGPGTGKTSILEEIKKRATVSGSLCLSATGFPDERGLPFSAVEQFGHVPGIPEGVRSAVRRLVDRAVPAPAGLLCTLTSALTEQAERGRIVIAVDDAHHLDPQSRSCLLYLARRLCSHPVTMVLAFPRTCCAPDGDPLEFLALPGARLAETNPLGEDNVRMLLERRLAARTAAGLAAPVHRAGGGNLCLVTALLHDLLRAGEPGPGTPVRIGESFRTAYLALLARHPALAEAVEALAALGDDATPPRAARLLGQPLKDVEHRLAELDRAGLLEGGGFRHPDVPKTVLGALGARLPALHRRAAALLFMEGAPATVVARHLLAADEPPDAAQVRVLRHAWQQYLTAGQWDRALASLRLADRADLDGRQRSKVLSALVITLCCRNPCAAQTEADRLLAAARAGHADCRALRVLVFWSLWFGNREQSREMMTRLIESCRPCERHGDMWGFATLAGSLWPGLLDIPAVRSYVRDQRDAAGTAVPGDENGDGTGRPLPATTDTRQFWGLDFASLLELIDRGELAPADRLCQELREGLPADAFPLRQASLEGLHARIRWYLGDARGAAAYAASALAVLPDHGWGVAIGLPLAALIAAHTLMGDLDQAARCLERPVLDEMWESAYGPLYRIARGGYLLETGRPRAALQDFLACAVDGRPDTVGWRACAAEAYLALGDTDRARRTAVEELVHGGRSANHRSRALLVLASVDGPQQRRTHLEEAERTLRTAGDRTLLAQVLARLGQEDLAQGRTRTTRERSDKALELATEGGVPHRIRPFTVPLGEEPAPAGPCPGKNEAPAAPESLTEAEWRVASLAAEGRSNRQIATQLYITVSTVEQHLTRVYRKLSARRRSELPDLLALGFRPDGEGEKPLEPPPPPRR